MIVLFLILTHPLVGAKVPACCSNVQNEKCRGACNQVHSQTSPIPQLQLLLVEAEGCTPDVVDFWQCINDNLPAVQMMSSQSGKACCDLARGKECRKKCAMADTKDGMVKFCRENMELSLFACIRRQEAGSQCCSKSTTSCNIVCQGIYLTGGGSTRATRNVLSQHCGTTDKHVEQCMHKQWHPQGDNSQNSLPCCEKAQTTHCQSTCRNVFRTVMSEDDRIDELIQACSEPQPTDPLWQCFLNNPSSKKNESSPISRVDNAKLQCCAKASSSRCRELCIQTYKSGWSYHTEFESTCSYIQPVSTVESNLHNCLTDVDQPCKLGCSGLSFCSNYNNRPTELFRSCTVEADDAAHIVYNSWKNGVIQLPQMTIPVKDISQCKPGVWKAIACALEIKPCSSQQSLITLCKEDCLFILTKCVDASSLSGERTVPALCNVLPSKTTAGACVSVDTYLYESLHTSKVTEVSHPCNSSPCSADEICLVRRRKCKHADGCQSYVCHKVCPLGQASKVVVPRGTDVRLVDLNESPSEGDCYVMCHCGSHGLFENCQSLICLKRDSCFLGHDNTKGHGEHFSIGGSLCTCSSGKVLCTRRSCQPDSYTPLYTGMPSNCPVEYKPVCGGNGKTYPNTCMASCAGMSTIIEQKPCSDVEVCSNKCSSSLKCVPHPQICLNEMSGTDHCPQYVCVDEREECNSHNHDPVCSSGEEEFTNICMLYSSRKTFGYWGHCQSSCSDTGVVCGHDGETYASECAAFAAKVRVDYFSKCTAFGSLEVGGAVKTVSCSRVQCPPIYPGDCAGIVPPGACCPICAAQMKLLWDSRLMAATANQTKTKVISVFGVLSQLSHHVSVLECDAFGYVSVIGELIVIIGSVVAQPSALQVEACQVEAKRIHGLLKMGSPNIVSYLTLSPIILSTLERSTVTFKMKDPVFDPFSDSDSSHNSSSVLAEYAPFNFAYVLFLVVCCFTHNAIERNFGP